MGGSTSRHKYTKINAKEEDREVESEKKERAEKAEHAAKAALRKTYRAPKATANMTQRATRVAKAAKGPAKPQNTFMKFCAEKRMEAKRAEARAPTAYELGAMWRTLTAEQKQEYKTQSS
jgi:hypothetical protein